MIQKFQTNQLVQSCLFSFNVVTVGPKDVVNFIIVVHVLWL